MDNELKMSSHPTGSSIPARPVFSRSHHSESTLTDTSPPSTVIIDFDYPYATPYTQNQLRFSAPILGNKPHLLKEQHSPPALSSPLSFPSQHQSLDDYHHRQQQQQQQQKQEETDLKQTSYQTTSFYHSCVNSCRHFRYQYRQFFAEFLGTFVMILLINGISAEQTLEIGNTKSWLTTSFGNGLAVLVAICISGHVSGAHLNPAVTLTFWAYSGFPRQKVFMYISAQLCGAFSGAAVLYTIILPAVDAFDQGERQILGPQGTAGIFATYPPLYAGPATAVASEIVGTALLLLLIMVTGHPNNMPFCSMQGIMIAAGLTAISLSLGYTSGFSLNPARDLGPRIFTAIAGWGPGVFTAASYYAFIPSFAPIVGGLIGGTVYKLCIDPYEPPSTLP